MSRLHIVEAEYHTELKGGAHRIKVSILDLGMYISGFRAFPPNDEHEDWWIFPPQRYVPGRKTINIVEFNKSEPLWKEIFDSCVACVQEYLRHGSIDKQQAIKKQKPDPELESLLNSYSGEDTNLEDFNNEEFFK